MDEIIDKSSTAVSQSETRNVVVLFSDIKNKNIDALTEKIDNIIAEGGTVNTELFNPFPSISGVFDTPDEAFNHTKHKIRINLHLGVALRSAVSQVKPKHIAAVLSGTVITWVTDIKTGSVNEALTPGRDLKLAGAKLKIAGDKSEIGLYFVGAA
jgi:hypothetical protein